MENSDSHKCIFSNQFIQQIYVYVYLYLFFNLFAWKYACSFLSQIVLTSF